jgi:hypothetical protein
VEGAEESRPAFVSCLTSFFKPFSFLNGDLPRGGPASLEDQKKVSGVTQTASIAIIGLVPLFPQLSAGGRPCLITSENGWTSVREANLSDHVFHGLT